MVLKALSVCTEFALDVKLWGEVRVSTLVVLTAVLECEILMEADGDITTSTSRPGGRPLAVDCKVELLVHVPPVVIHSAEDKTSPGTSPRPPVFKGRS